MTTAVLNQLNAILTAWGGKFTLLLARLGLPSWLPALDIHSKMVGRTGFEPVTSSVSGCRYGASGQLLLRL